VVTAGTTDGTITVRAADYEATDCYSEATLTLIRAEVSTVGFRSDHLIRKWPAGPNIDDLDGSAPVWISGGINDPVSYTKNTAPELFTVFSVTPNTATVSGVSVRAKIGATVLGSTTNTTISGGSINDAINADGDVDGITGGAAFPGADAVRTLQPNIEWEISLDATHWCPAGTSGTHTVYVTEATPGIIPPYDLALAKACGYVNGNGNITLPICTGIDGEILYDPGEPTPRNPLAIYGIGRAQCEANAMLMQLLLDSVGVASDLTYFWGGTSPNRVDYYKYVGWWGPSFRVLSPQHDLAPANPSFTFHCVATHAGIHYDPSYGVIRTAPTVLTFDEAAPAGSEYYDKLGNLLGTLTVAATPQTGSAFPPANVYFVNWVSGHRYVTVSVAPLEVRAGGIVTATATALVAPPGAALTWTIAAPDLGATVTPATATTATVTPAATGGTITIRAAHVPTNDYAETTLTIVQVSGVTATPNSVPAGVAATISCLATTVPIGRTLTWSIEPPPHGCTVNSTTGIVTVTAASTPGTVTIRATDAPTGAFGETTIELTP